MNDIEERIIARLEGGLASEGMSSLKVARAAVIGANVALEAAIYIVREEFAKAAGTLK